MIALAIIFAISCVALAIYSIIITNENRQLKANIGQGLTKNSEIVLGENQSQVAAISIVNNVVSGVNYPQKISINSNYIVSAQVLRAKAQVISSDCEVFDCEIKATNNWIKGGDGYYYYLNVVNSPDTFLLCEEVMLPIGFSIQNKNKNKHVLVVSAETITFNLGIITSVWGEAPKNWLYSIQNQ